MASIKNKDVSARFPGFDAGACFGTAHLASRGHPDGLASDPRSRYLSCILVVWHRTILHNGAFARTQECYA